MKRHHAAIERSGAAPPGDSLIGNLFGDFSVEVFLYTTKVDSDSPK
jgi:hypothetical protein